MTSRLTDEQLAALQTMAIGAAEDGQYALAEGVHLAIAELRTLRAAALSEEEREALVEVLHAVRPRDGGMPGMVSPVALAALHRLTAKEM